MKRSLCKKEGCNNPAWSKGLCKNHIEYKPLRKSAYKKRETPNDMHEFFMDIWNERAHYSELSGEYLGKEPSSAFFHHILPKEKYPELGYMKSNIILLTLEEHGNVENDMYKYELINERREQLLNQTNK